jgi:hypothetical protein
MHNSHIRSLAMFLAAATFAGCSSGSRGVMPMTPAGGQPMSQTPMMAQVDMTSMLKLLKKKVVIGSTVDPMTGDLNPYGLTVATGTSGPITKGDLVVCSFNAKSNVQGTGTTIDALHPTPGSKPIHIVASKVLKGCAALALDPSGFIWATAFSANDNPVFSSAGTLIENLKGSPLDHPWGQVYAAPASGPTFYETNAGNGAVIRFDLSTGKAIVIATGFAVNHGKPGGILAPSGLAYDTAKDTLYIVDGTNNTLVALEKVTSIGAGGVKVGKNGKTFTGPSAKNARLVFSGAPLNASISTALLPNGNLIVGNTGNPNGTNLMVELTPAGKVLATRNVDKGAAGALFGIVATGTSDADTKIYFNDDNNNNLQALVR